MKKNMHRKFGAFLFAAISFFAVCQVSFAIPASFTFDVSLSSNSVLDPVRSGDNTLGFDNWYVWKYKVTVISSGTRGHGLSHWVLELPVCYLTESPLFQEIEASAGWGGGDKVRIFAPDTADPDPTTGLSGIKWDFVSGDELDTVGEYDYFWFSAPTNLDIETDWAVKAGREGIFASGQVEGPECPSEPQIPEPASLVLFCAGMAGARIFLKKRNISA